MNALPQVPEHSTPQQNPQAPRRNTRVAEPEEVGREPRVAGVEQDPWPPLVAPAGAEKTTADVAEVGNYFAKSSEIF